MSEETALRERLRQIAWGATTGVPIDPEHIDAIVDGFLAALTEAGALAPAALTGDERWAVDFAADCLDGIVAGEQFDAYIRNRAAHHAGALRSLWRRSDSYAADAATGAPS